MLKNIFKKDGFMVAGRCEQRHLFLYKAPLHNKITREEFSRIAINKGKRRYIFGSD